MRRWQHRDAPASQHALALDACGGSLVSDGPWGYGVAPRAIVHRGCILPLLRSIRIYWDASMVGLRRICNILCVASLATREKKRAEARSSSEGASPPLRRACQSTSPICDCR